MTRLALVPVREGLLSWFVVRLMRHPGGEDTTGFLEPMKGFLKADPIVFWSADGDDLRLFFLLRKPVPIAHFVAWGRSWGFNVQGRPAIEPSSTRQQAVDLPTTAAGQDGDQFISGRMDAIDGLPDILPKGMEREAWNLLQGVVEKDKRMEVLGQTVKALTEKEFDKEKGAALVNDAIGFSDAFHDDDPGELGESLGGLWKEAEEAYQAARVTDLRAADQIRASEPGSGLLWCPERHSWYRWNGRLWRPVFVEEVHSVIQQYIRDKKSAERMEAGAHLEGVAKHLRAICVTEARQLDSDGYLFNVENGTIDLRTGRIRPHRREDLITRMAPVEWDPNVELTPDKSVWVRTLHEVFGGPELADFLGRCVGYALTGDTREEVLFMLIGDGGNGKSTLMESIMAMAGDYGIKSPASLLLRRSSGAAGSDSYAMADLEGRRIVLASEIERGAVLRDANLKDLVDGRGIMTGRQIRQRHHGFERTHKIFLYGNYDPNVVAADDGTWRRLRKIPFTRRFGSGARNVQLKERLIARHLPEVLGWAVRGCLDWLRHGLQVPESVNKATEDFRREQDVVGRFLSERTVQHDGPGWAVGSLYAEYDRWRRADGEPALSKRELGAELRRRRYSQMHTTVDGVNGRFWVGLKRKQDARGGGG